MIRAHLPCSRCSTDDTVVLLALDAPPAFPPTTDDEEATRFAAAALGTSATVEDEGEIEVNAVAMDRAGNCPSRSR